MRLVSASSPDPPVLTALLQEQWTPDRVPGPTHFPSIPHGYIADSLHRRKSFRNRHLLHLVHADQGDARPGRLRKMRSAPS